MVYEQSDGKFCMDFANKIRYTNARVSVTDFLFNRKVLFLFNRKVLFLFNRKVLFLTNICLLKIDRKWVQKTRLC